MASYDTQKHHDDATNHDDTQKHHDDATNHDDTQTHHDDTTDSLSQNMNDITISEHQHASENYVLVCNDDRIIVRKDALQTHSGYLRSRISFYEHATGQYDGGVEIMLDNLHVDGLHKIVEFVTDGDVSLDISTVSDTFKAADFLDIPLLKSACQVYLNDLTSNIVVTNCVDAINIALELKEFNMEELFKASRDFIVDNFHNLPKDQYTNIQEDMLITLLGEDRLKAMSEITLVTVVKDWMEFNKEINFDISKGDLYVGDARETFVRLMDEIRWALITPEELSSVDHGVMAIMNQITPCWKLLQEARDYHSDVHKQPFNQSKHTRVRNDGKSLWINSSINSSKNSIVYIFKNDEKHSFVKFDTDTTYIIIVENFLYVFSGCTKAGRYDPRFKSWLTLNSMTKERFTFSGVACGPSLYIVGGDRYNNEYHTMERFDMGTNSWGLCIKLPTKVRTPSVCGVNNDVYMSGGSDRNGSVKSVYKYSTLKGMWEKCADMLRPRTDHIMEALGQFIYVIGGIIITVGYAGYFMPKEELVDPIEKYCTLSDQWTQCKQTVSVRDVGSYVHDDKIYIVGGNEERCEVKVFSEDLDDIYTAYTLPKPCGEPFFGCGLMDLPYDFWNNMPTDDTRYCILQ